MIYRALADYGGLRFKIQSLKFEQTLPRQDFLGQIKLCIRFDCMERLNKNHAENIMSETKSSDYLEMPVAELVKALSEHAFPGSPTHAEIKGALSVILIKSLTDSIDRHEQAATRLSLQLLWLNIILGVFTLVGTILTIIAFFVKPHY